MQKQIIGWDIGGAHVKAALLNGNGEVLRVIQEPCPLWKGMDHLDYALATILRSLGSGPHLHVMTMTGELVDCFPGREHGVNAIIQTMQAKICGEELLVFAGREGFLNVDGIRQAHYMAIASANWLASAELAAERCRTGLFVDIGSSTTDILLIENHALQALGYTDYQRLVSGELLYTGIVRTAVMAIAQRAEFNGQEMGLMAEYFATMADVYRLTGDLNEAHDQAETADGAEKTPLASARRLSRLTGYEFTEADWPMWLQFARQLKQRQKHTISQACLKQIERSVDATELCLIGAGVGRFVVRELAGELGFPYRDFAEFIMAADDETVAGTADCAPAVAVAYLAGGFC
ncbi:MAG: H4MPT-linked C1 transfer pathway protein [Methylococcaceae bacterium]|nr:H4MPT-linked C1 transfer pathway protein [Methylococcaceae bacterium]